MKKILLTLSVSCASLAYSQNLNFTDLKFKALLLSSNSTNEIGKDINGNSIAIDQNGDGEIQISEAQQVKILNIKISDQTYIDPNGNRYDPDNINTAYYDSHLPDDISDAVLFSNLEELYFWNTKTANISFANHGKIKKVQGRPFYYDFSQSGQYTAAPINLSFDNCPGIQDINDVIAYQVSGNPWYSPENSLSIKNSHLTNGNIVIENTELQEFHIQNTNVNTLTFNSCKFLSKISVPNLNTLTKISVLGNSATNEQNIELIANNCTNLEEIIANTDHYETNGAYFSSVNLNGCSALKKIMGLNASSIDFSTAGLINLEELDCSYYNRYGYNTTSGIYFGNVTALHLAGLPKLKTLKAFNQKISNNVNFSAAQALENIDLTNSCGYMNTVNVSNLPHLHTLRANRHYTDGTSGADNLQNIITKNCTALTNFQFDYNSDLRKLDLENCPGLQNLTIGISLADKFSNLQEINLTQCTGFKEISVNSTKISTLDTNDCSALQSLTLSYNHLLTSLNISNNTNLESLSLSSLLLLPQVNTSGNVNVKNVYFNICPQITQLDFSTSSHLETVTFVNMPKLNSVNLRNGSLENFWEFMNYNSNLSVCVDDAQLNDFQTAYPDITFTTNCGATLSTAYKKISKPQVKVFPNPVKDFLQINSVYPVKNIKLIDNQQRVIFNQNFNQEVVKIDLSSYPTAVYFIKITTEKSETTEKIIKK